MKLFLVLLFAFSCFYCKSQENKVFSHTINLEALGVGYYGSVNYELQLNRFSILKPLLQVGLSTNRMKNANNNFDPELIFPLSIGTLIGKKHQLELGFGGNFTRYTQSLNTNQVQSFSKVLTSNIGYRYTHNQVSLTFNIYYFLNSNYSLAKFWPGFGFIYQFPTK